MAFRSGLVVTPALRESETVVDARIQLGGICPAAHPAIASGYQVPLAAIVKKPAASRYRRSA